MRTGIFCIQVQRVGLHEGARKVQHITGGEGEATRVFEYLSGFQFIKVAPVLWVAHLVQLHRDVRGDLGLRRQWQ